MARSSRADAAKHRGELVQQASRLFRERGVDAVSLLDAMGAIGLTRGGFYKHFESKEALVAAAVGAAFEQHLERLEQCADEQPDDPAHTRSAFLDFCLSTENRDDPGAGCPSPFVTDVARSPNGARPRDAFLRGTQQLLEALREKAADDETPEEAVLADLATTVGAVLLARATAGDPISDAILAAARRRLG
jgi:TetR/AcrR family transcriptional repressor of nem operon